MHLVDVLLVPFAYRRKKHLLIILLLFSMESQHRMTPHELVAHHFGLMLEVIKIGLFSKSTVCNAFNSISRCDMLKQVSKAFPDLSSHIQQMYGPFNKQEDLRLQRN